MTATSTRTGWCPVAVLASLPALGGELPPTFLVGCRPADTGERIGLSEPVAAAVPVAADAVRTLVRRAGRRAGPGRGGRLAMCLGIPGQVIEMVEGYGGQLALVDVSGAARKINIGMLELDQQNLAPGDWVLIHMGFAVERVDAAGAEQAMQGLELMGRGRDVDD